MRSGTLKTAATPYVPVPERCLRTTAKVSLGVAREIAEAGLYKAFLGRSFAINIGYVNY